MTSLEIARQQVADAHRVFSADPARAGVLAEEAIPRAIQGHSQEVLIDALRVRGMAHGARGAIEAAHQDFSEGLQRSRMLGDRRREGQCLHGLAMTYRHQGDYARAIPAMIETVAIRREVGESAALALSLSTLSAFYGERGDYAAALPCLEESRTLSQSVGDLHGEMLALCNQGMLHLACDELPLAVRAFRACIERSDRRDDADLLAGVFTNLANTLCRLGDLEKALDAARDALKHAHRVGSAFRLTDAWMTIGTVHARSGKRQAAETAFCRALTAARGEGAAPLLAPLLHAIGGFQAEIGDTAGARARLEEGLEVAVASQQKAEICALHAALSTVCEADGDLAAALHHARAHHTAHRALQTESARHQLLAQSARLEVAQVQAQVRTLKRQTLEDPLTGLFNRRYLDAHLAGTARPLVVALVDLDGFKAINDRLGHRIGDQVLRTVAEILRRHCRPEDTVVRYGGEEFLLVLELPIAPARVICRRVRAAIAAYAWHRIADGLTVTVSIGVASGTSSGLPTLLVDADQRMYRAKRAGKNRVVSR
jgi:diguanylate cyclase (GGDEF)-like protein